MELVDPRLGSYYITEETMRKIKVALLCTNSSPALMPTISSVVSMLKGDVCIQKLGLNPHMHRDDFSSCKGSKTLK